jgi:hypothetical protein
VWFITQVRENLSFSSFFAAAEARAPGGGKFSFFRWRAGESSSKGAENEGF